MTGLKDGQAELPNPQMDRRRWNSNCRQEQPVPSVIRTALADHVRSALTTGPATRAARLAAVVAGNARPEAIQPLQRLPDGTYTNVRELC